MIYRIILLFTLINSFAFSQESDSTGVAYKKRVLEGIEVDFLVSYYKQNGVHSSVSGGIGSEKLTDLASNIVVAIPLNEDDVLTVDMGISAYTSASSSNINPFNASGASGGGDDDDDDDDDRVNPIGPYGTPWQASSGASAQDALGTVVVNYSHSSDDRNLIWNADVAFSNEYDYTSIGFGGGISKLFNNKNSEVSIKGNVYLDQWRPIYPTELHEYAQYGNNFLNEGFFQGIIVLDQNENATTSYLPSDFNQWDKTNRNSYSLSFGFSQVATRKMQFSVFFDVLHQEGMLSTPYHRVYFADKANYYIGEAQYIPVYETIQNTGVYQLADDIERLPGTRFKLPFGGRLNYYLNERLTIRTYYRYYWDDWGITSHTASIELPIKLTDRFTVFPMYRYYVQVASKYFAPFETHLSTEKYYTSDYDLSTFNANQYGFGVGYTDILTNAKIWKFGLKSMDLRFNHYDRNDGLIANIVTFGIKFVQQ